jgi:hypothetical protein
MSLSVIAAITSKMCLRLLPLNQTAPFYFSFDYVETYVGY